MYDTVIQNANIVSSETTVLGDVAVRGERVVAILEPNSHVLAHKVIDAAGKYLIPGLIDPHTHIEHLSTPGVSTVDDFLTSTVSGALGGVTTVIDFAIQTKGVMPMDIIEKRLHQAEKAAVDYAFHACLTEVNDRVIGQMKDVAHMGIPSFKVFMAYRSKGRQCDDGALLAILEEAKKHGILVGAHTENGDIIEYNVAKALREGHRSAIYHALTRPRFAEEECMGRALFLARVMDSPFYNFHVSIGRGVQAISRERANGRPVYAEAMTHHLVFTKEVLNQANGIYYICSPPMREQEDIEELWKGLAEGIISTTGSDHCVFSTQQKEVARNSFDKVPNGVWGLGSRLPILYSDGVLQGRLSINRMVAATSTNAARILGLFPRKGMIAPGSDADMVLIDSDREKVLCLKESSIDVDWFPYEGRRVKGFPVLTMLRGKVIVEDGRFIGKRGEGEFIHRRIDPEVLRYPVA